MGLTKNRLVYVFISQMGNVNKFGKLYSTKKMVVSIIKYIKPFGNAEVIHKSKVYNLVVQMHYYHHTPAASNG